jgi:hypothetical protein
MDHNVIIMELNLKTWGFFAYPDNYDEETAKTLQEEYGIDVASCVGALFFLSYTRLDITYDVV